jgi:hypothetical protein
VKYNQYFEFKPTYAPLDKFKKKINMYEQEFPEQESWTFQQRVMEYPPFKILVSFQGHQNIDNLNVSKTFDGDVLPSQASSLALPQ